jgi:hypothetical protein
MFKTKKDLSEEIRAKVVELATRGIEAARATTASELGRCARRADRPK